MFVRLEDKSPVTHTQIIHLPVFGIATHNIVYYIVKQQVGDFLQ